MFPVKTAERVTKYNNSTKPRYIHRRWRGNGSIIADIWKPIYYDYPKHRGKRGYPVEDVFVRDITEEEYLAEKMRILR